MLAHHAYLVRSEIVTPDSVKFAVSKLKVEEVVYVNIDSFGIGEVRTLTQNAFVAPLLGKIQLIVVSTNSITVEAQQALLKILEEPPSTTAFLFCIPKTLYILPTLLSRFCEDFSLVEEVSVRTHEAFIEFSKLQLTERIAEIANRLVKKDQNWIEQIKAGLLDKLVKEGKGTNFTKLPLLVWIAEHLQTRGASNKMLLEELALTLEVEAEKI